MKRKMFIINGLLIFYLGNSWSQSVILPNYGLKSHKTLVINKIETTVKTTTIFLTIENRVERGAFCADMNIFLIYPDGTRSKLVSSGGIPVCPDTYKFKTIGEKLDFTLIFLPIKQGIEWIDLIEDCADNCFSFYGITLNSDLNRKIEDAFFLAENDEPEKALISFIDIAEGNDVKNKGSQGLVYVNIIRLARETGNATQAAEWYNKLKSSEVPRLSQYIEYLSNQGIKY